MQYGQRLDDVLPLGRLGILSFHLGRGLRGCISKRALSTPSPGLHPHHGKYVPLTREQAMESTSTTQRILLRSR